MFEFGWCQNSNMSWALRPFDGEIFIFSYWLHQRVFILTLVASKIEKLKQVKAVTLGSIALIKLLFGLTPLILGEIKPFEEKKIKKLNDPT